MWIASGTSTLTKQYGTPLLAVSGAADSMVATSEGLSSVTKLTDPMPAIVHSLMGLEPAWLTAAKPSNANRPIALAQ
ncbi:MAG: hypothetical protein ACXWTP_14415 [Methylosarcina sp.]